MAAVTMTLEEKVYAMLTEQSPEGPIAACSNRIDVEGSHLTSWENDLRDWGMVYGFAYGVARAENPWQPEALAIGEALNAARAAFARWGGPIASRPDGQAVAAAAQAVQFAYSYANRDGAIAKSDPDLHAALGRLFAAIGDGEAC